MVNELTVATPDVIAFIRESNRIEGIKREPTTGEIEEHQRFMALDSITAADLKQFVKVYQPDAELRDKAGLNVMVGGYYPPVGGVWIKGLLSDVLDFANANVERSGAAYECHQLYEGLHPFTDGNGRSGRMLWLWMMREAPLGFLHTWYYQSLSARRHD